MRWLNALLKQSLCIKYPLLIPETKSYLQKRLNWRERSICRAILDNQNQMIDCEEMFKGTVDRVEVHPREIIRQSIKKRTQHRLF